MPCASNGLHTCGFGVTDILGQLVGLARELSKQGRTFIASTTIINMLDPVKDDATHLDLCFEVLISQ